MTNLNTGNITFISAGAGSGKTTRLTELLYQALRAGHARPAGVIATTFTRKAAAELRERVREDLIRKSEFDLANAMGQAKIGTVHSVCSQLVSRFAFEAGLSTDQQVLEEKQAATLLQGAVDMVLNDQRRRELLSVSRRLGLEEDWKDALKVLVEHIRSNDIDLERVRGFAQANADALLAHFPPPLAEEPDNKLLKEIDRVLPEIEDAAQTGQKQNTNAYLKQLQQFKQRLEWRSAVPWGDWVKLSRAAPEARLRQTIEPIAELAGSVAAHPRLHADLRRYLDYMFELAASAVHQYQEIKRGLGVLDFADQEHQLLGLLDHPEVEEVLANELELIMVDEFQDTSPIQLALFQKLARFAKKKVYWVGDIKQSIYGFRGSDTRLMEAILAALPDLGGKKEVLSTSYRSRPELVQVVNAVFSHAFADSLSREEVELEPDRDTVLDNSALANWILEGRNIPQRASALASGVAKLVESAYTVVDKESKQPRAVRYGDIAILSRSNDGVKTLAAALSHQGIPVATAQAGLLATPEASLAMACLRRLNDPSDTVATAEIVSLADGLAPEQWVADRLRYLRAGGSPEQWLEQPFEAFPAVPLLQTLADLRSSLLVLAPREALATVIATCELSDKIVRWTPDPTRARIRLANLEALLALAAKYEDECRSGQRAASISGLILWLGEAARSEQDMIAEPAINAVNIMTHHTAKGLEWPVVILTDLAKDIRDRLWSISAQSDGSIDAHNPLANRTIHYWPWPFGKQKHMPLVNDIAKTTTAQAFREEAIEEEKRLLYVSMTRARDLLILARSKREPTGEWLDTVKAPWLLPDADSQSITLPSGEEIAADYWQLEPPPESDTAPAAEPAPIHWFPPPTALTSRKALNFQPSAANKVSTTLREQCRIGERIAIAPGVDMSLLGTALHACIGASFTDLRAPLSETEVASILAGFGVGNAVAPNAVLSQVTALHGWINSRWPSARAYAEIPVQSVLPEGQVLNGRIDLLLDTDKGWVLIDHKSSPLASEQWAQLAQDHGAQLAAYAEAVTQATGRPVQECWLFLPVAGGGVAVAWEDLA